MAEDKIFYPEEIQDNPFPGKEEQNLSVSQASTGITTSPDKISETKVMPKRVAVELLSTVLNTKSKKILGEFELADSGGIRIGKYANGVNGELVLTPAGMTAKNMSGITTFNIDGDTGDATFAGKVQAGAVVTGTLAVGNNNVLIDGENERIIIYDDSGIPRILLGYQENGF